MTKEKQHPDPVSSTFSLDGAQAIPRLWLNNGNGTFSASAQDL
ncbi:hypothetical protein [uncultured Alteromonas sp.]|jgi:hypothetical protein|nr:hypothetical protein [uncultured Alteromonas sp.]